MLVCCVVLVVADTLGRSQVESSGGLCGGPGAPHSCAPAATTASPHTLLQVRPGEQRQQDGQDGALEEVVRNPRAAPGAIPVGLRS